MRKGFTLIEMLIVIAIIAILATTLTLVLRPGESLQRARDEQRVKDLETLKGALILYTTTEGTFSLSGNCTAGQPCKSTGCIDSETGDYVSTCTGTNKPENIDGTGWIPLDFMSLPGGSPVDKLVTDPINDDTYYYRFAVDSDKKNFEIDCLFESKLYNESKNIPAKDGGNNDSVYEVGSDMTILGSR